VATSVLVAAACGAGCRNKSEGFERYVPASGVARAAVESMLKAWTEGRPIGEAAATHPEVFVVDKHRKDGQKLARHELIGEVSTDRARGFAVRLTLENPDEQEVARYMVVGIDPIWVFRQEDFELISHWMHPMPKPGDSDPAQEPSSSRKGGP
jgi:hypothetical protein